MGVHDGHRQRLKEVYKNGGLAALSDINLLELLLFYSIPRKDTNEIAHNLINAFGSVENVFKAEISELERVDGVTENSALLIKLLPDIQNRIEESGASAVKYINSSQDAGRHFSALLSRKYEEFFYIMCLDAGNKVLNVSLLSKGSINEVNVTIRSIVDNVVRYKASSVILAHNHPDGICKPSEEDIELTNRIISSLGGISISVLDHIIITHDSYYSFADNSLI